MSEDGADLLRDGAPTAAVFSHPNHELAVFGLLQGVRPTLVYLTDGGGERRVAQTRRGLAGIGLEDRARFLGYTERSFYAALLERDAGFYREVAARVHDVLADLEPARVLCDAVEFYNPVHDMSLPIVRAALHDAPATAVYEVPLVQQKTAGEAYRIQRPCDDRRGAQLEWWLAPAELDAKVRARDEVYTILTAQMGELVAGIPAEELAVEVVTPARATLPEPGDDRVLRYEWRARLLLERGEIERAITYAGHWLPVASALL